MKGQTYVILSLVFIIIVAIFAIVNIEPVEVNYLFWSGASPLILVILFSVLMGGIITAMAGTVKLYKLQKQVKQLKSENQKMKDKLEDHDLIENSEPVKKSDKIEQ